MVTKKTRLVAAALVAGLLLVGLGAVLSEKWLTNAAFGKLESDEATQYALRITIALDYEVKLLQGFGATNSVWTDAYDAVRDSDAGGFLDAFAPSQIKPVSDIDAVIGVGPDGAFRLGGSTAGAGSDFEPLPSALTDTQTLRGMIDPAGEAGAGMCGIIVPGDTGYLYCSFRAADNNAGGPAVGNLIFLKALDATRLAGLSKAVDMPLTLVTAARDGDVTELPSELGTIKVTSTAISAEETILDVALPAPGGTAVTLEFSRPRSIHAVATSWSNKMMAVLGGLLLLIVVAVIYSNRRSVVAKVRPLRETAEQIIASGDRSLRINAPAHGEIGALGGAIDSMLDALAVQQREVEAAQVEREAQLRESSERERQRDAELSAQAKESIAAATGSIEAELERIRQSTSSVHDAANSIERLVGDAAQLTRSVRGQSEAAGEAVTQLTSSLQDVAGVAEMIAGVARQTNLLALNATIEAARAGDAGKGFGVVANEVKELATATSSATANITTTIEKLLSDAEAMSLAITAVQSGVVEIDGATGEVGSVTGSQRETAELLGQSVDEAIGRLHSLVAAE